MTRLLPQYAPDIPFSEVEGTFELYKKAGIIDYTSMAIMTEYEIWQQLCRASQPIQPGIFGAIRLCSHSTPTIRKVLIAFATLAWHSASPVMNVAAEIIRSD